jgi:type IV pilus assembly protein PilW
MTTRPSSMPARSRSRGVTLIELMVGIAAGMLIVAAMSLLFANNSRSRAETERASQKIENGRYAVDLLATDLEHAGFFHVFDPRPLPLPAVKPDPCEKDSIANLQAAMGVHVQGYDDSASGLTCLSDVKAGTDVLVIRRASTCAAGVGTCPALAADNVGFQASSCSNGMAGELASSNIANHYRLSATPGDFTLHRRNCTTVSEVRKYLVRIYYVANNDKSGDGIPTLKRAELGAIGSNFTTTSLVQGVENLQLEYGMDTNTDGNPDVYSASPDLYQTCTNTSSPTCVGYWSRVVAAKVFVLTRNLDGSPGYVDDKTYELGRVATATGSGDPKTIAPFNDNYKRAVFQEMVRLQNPSGRRLSPS